MDEDEVFSSFLSSHDKSNVLDPAHLGPGSAPTLRIFSMEIPLPGPSSPNRPHPTPIRHPPLLRSPGSRRRVFLKRHTGQRNRVPAPGRRQIGPIWAVSLQRLFVMHPSRPGSRPSPPFLSPRLRPETKPGRARVAHRHSRPIHPKYTEARVARCVFWGLSLWRLLAWPTAATTSTASRPFYPRQHPAEPRNAETLAADPRSVAIGAGISKGNKLFGY